MYLLLFICYAILQVIPIIVGMELYVPSLSESLLDNQYSEDEVKKLGETLRSNYTSLGFMCLLVFIVSLLFVIDNASYFSNLEEYDFSPIFNLGYNGLVGDGLINSIYSYIVILPAGLCCIYYFAKRTNLKNKIELALENVASRELIEEQKSQECQDAFMEAYIELRKQYGQPDALYSLREDDMDWSILPFSSSKVLFVQGQIINFKDIISCQLLDNHSVVTNTSGYTDSISEVDHRNLAGRAIVGELVNGKTGAIIGAATVKRNIRSKHHVNTITSTKHNYVVLIGTKNIANPIVKIYCYEDEHNAYSIAGMVNAIIAQTKK